MEYETKGREGTSANGHGKESKLVKINKTGTVSKSLGKEMKGKADDVSNSFPNFSVLNGEEKLAFFEALSAARKSVEKRDGPIRERFGTVHDEYLLHFAGDDKEEKKMEKKPESASSARPRLSPTAGRKNAKEQDGLSKPPKKRVLRSPKPVPPLLKNVLKPPQQDPPRPESEPVDTCETIIQSETDKMIQLYFNKKQRVEDQAKKSFRENKIPQPKTAASKGSKANQKQTVPPKSPKANKKQTVPPKSAVNQARDTEAETSFRMTDTPQFEALEPTEREEFFRILREAHANILEKNPQKKKQIFTMEDLASLYGRDVGGVVTTVCTATEDVHKGKGQRKNLRVKVTLSSGDNKRLCRTKSETLSDGAKEGLDRSKSLEGLKCSDKSRGKQNEIPISKKEQEEEDECDSITSFKSTQDLEPKKEEKKCVTVSEKTACEKMKNGADKKGTKIKAKDAETSKECEKKNLILMKKKILEKKKEEVRNAQKEKERLQAEAKRKEKELLRQKRREELRKKQQEREAQRKKQHKTKEQEMQALERKRLNKGKTVCNDQPPELPRANKKLTEEDCKEEVLQKPTREAGEECLTERKEGEESRKCFAERKDEESTECFMKRKDESTECFMKRKDEESTECFMKRKDEESTECFMKREDEESTKCFMKRKDEESTECFMKREDEESTKCFMKRKDEESTECFMKRKDEKSRECFTERKEGEGSVRCQGKNSNAVVEHCQQSSRSEVPALSSEEDSSSLRQSQEVASEECRKGSRADSSENSCTCEDSKRSLGRLTPEEHMTCPSTQGSAQVVETASCSMRSLAQVSLVEERSREEGRVQKSTPNCWSSKVIVVDDNVITKIKSLIQYLENKVSQESDSENEYVKLVLGYTEYLTKMAECFLGRNEEHGQKVQRTYTAHDVHLTFKDKVLELPIEEKKLPGSVNDRDLHPIAGPSGIEKTPTDKVPIQPSSGDLLMLSDSESSTNSDDENNYTFAPSSMKRPGIPTTKIRLLQDLLQGRAGFAEGSTDDLKIVHYPEPEFVPPQKTQVLKELKEGDDDHVTKTKHIKFLRKLIKLCSCGRKKVEEDAIFENLQGEAIRVDMIEGKKDPASATINPSTMEVLKAAERKKIINKYFKRDHS